MTAPAADPTLRWGLTIPLDGLSLADHVSLLPELRRLGYSDVWSSETNGADAFTPLALAAASAPELRLGTAIVSPFLRGPALLAMSFAGLADAAPGRVYAGIGTATPAIVEGWNGLPFEAPYQRMRDTLRFLRSALRGEQVSERYRTFAVERFRLAHPPAQPPPLLLAALREGMLGLAREEADGAIINWLSADDVRRVAAIVGAGKELVARIFVCCSEDVAAVRTMARRLIAAYLSLPAYAAFHEWLGRGPELAPMWEAWRAGDRAGAAELVPEVVVDALIVHGSPERCRAGVQCYVESGVTVPVIAVLPLENGSAIAAARALGHPELAA